MPHIETTICNRITMCNKLEERERAFIAYRNYTIEVDMCRRFGNEDKRGEFQS